MVSATGFALQGLFTKAAYQAGSSTATVGAVRFVLTAVVLWIYAAVRRRWGSFPLALPRRTALSLIALGAVGYFLGSLFYFVSLRFISVSLAGLLLYTYPAIATMLAVLAGRERWTSRLGIGLVTTLSGVALTLGSPLLSSTVHTDWRGILLILFNASVYATYIVISDRTVRGVHSVLALAYIATGAALSYAVLTAVTRGLTLSMGLQGWGAIAAMALFSTVLAAGAFLAGMRRLGPARAATLSTLEPLLTVLLAAVLLGERLQPSQLAGGLIILVGVLVIIRERSESPIDSAVESSVDGSSALTS